MSGQHGHRASAVQFGTILGNGFHSFYVVLRWLKSAMLGSSITYGLHWRWHGDCLMGTVGQPQPGGRKGGTMKTKAKKDERAKDQAKTQFESIKEMVEHLEHVKKCHDADCDLSDAEIYAGLGLYYVAGHPTHGAKATEEQREQYHDEEGALQTIQEDPLSVEVRSCWHTPCDKDAEDGEYMILLCTGGPAVRIVGTMGRFNEPDSAKIEYQDWFTPWEEYRLDSEEETVVLTYARQFYFAD